MEGLLTDSKLTTEQKVSLTEEVSPVENIGVLNAKISALNANIHTLEVEISDIKSDISKNKNDCSKFEDSLDKFRQDHQNNLNEINRLTELMAVQSNIESPEEVDIGEMAAIIDNIHQGNIRVGEILQVIHKNMQQLFIIKAIIFEKTKVIAVNHQLLAEKERQLAEKEQKKCKNLILIVKQKINAFTSGIGKPVIEFLTDEKFKKPPKDSDDCYWTPPWVIEYRERSIELLGPLVQSSVVDTRTEHSCNSFNSPYCNGLQGAKNEIHTILSTISKILPKIDEILHTLKIDTRYPYQEFSDMLFESVHRAIDIIDTTDHHLDNIIVGDFSKCRDSGWNTIKYIDDIDGDWMHRYAYDDRIKKTFEDALHVLNIFAKIQFI